MGVPLISESESAQDTAELCVKLFSGLGVDVSISEIDIAHRVPQRDTSTGNGNRREPKPIICKFTRRMTRDTKTKLSKDETISSFSVFHNNVVSLNRNLENLQTQLLHEVDFHFNVIGVTETKITNANSQMCTAHIPGYVFEYVPTPLASRGCRKVY